MLDWHSCQICYPLEIKILLLLSVIGSTSVTTGVLCLSPITGHISVIYTRHEVYSTAMFDLPLIQVEQLSVHSPYCLNT